MIKHVFKKIRNHWLGSTVLILAAISPVKSAVLDWNWVPTGSMKPSILEGELVLVNKLSYDLKVPFTTTRLMSWGDPLRGDVTVFFSPKDGTRTVKRVIGLPGDTIEMRNNVVWVNGAPLDYTGVDPTPFRDMIYEDRAPLLAIEHLGQTPHLVLALPGQPAVRSFRPHVVPAGHYFMMGDSRDNSLDSRFVGSIPREAIVGKVTEILVSFDPRRYLWPRFSRFLSEPS